MGIISDLFFFSEHPATHIRDNWIVARLDTELTFSVN